MSCCGARKNHRIRWCSILFDRGHSLLLAVSATGSARKRPHFDTSPYFDCNMHFNKRVGECQVQYTIKVKLFWVFLSFKMNIRMLDEFFL